MRSGDSLPASPTSLKSMVNLDVAADQWAGPVDVRRSPDAERIGGTWLATVIHLNREAFRRRAGRSDHLSRASERRVGVRPTGSGADEKPIYGLGLYADIHGMIVVLQVAGRRATLHREAEGAVRGWIGRTGNQSR